MLLKLKSFLVIFWESVIEAQKKRAEYYVKTGRYME